MNKVINFQSKEQNSLPIAGFLEVSYTSHTHTRHEERGREREGGREGGKEREREETQGDWRDTQGLGHDL